MNIEVRTGIAMRKLHYQPHAPADPVFGATVPEWTTQALCAQVDPEIFFPEQGGSTEAAKRVCVGCPVRSECLAWALVNREPFGIWGGMSERERGALRRGKHVEINPPTVCETCGRGFRSGRSLSGHLRQTRHESSRAA
jgi:WhiB family redox-sensing transcriptional regulator